MNPGTFFSRRWWWKTLLVLLAMGVMVRLGLWQLDRLEQRRAANAALLARLEAEVISVDGGPLPGAPEELADRRAVVTGTYDYDRQILIKNRFHQEQPGYWVVTPLRIQDSERAILVVRGWIPLSLADPARWPEFQEGTGDEPQTLEGYLQPGQRPPRGAQPEAPDTFQREWFRLDISAIQRQMPYDLLPVYFQAAAEPGRSFQALPVRLPAPATELSEGNHLSYALQWFSFALIAAIVYGALVYQQEARAAEHLRGESRNVERIHAGRG